MEGVEKGGWRGGGEEGMEGGEKEVWMLVGPDVDTWPDLLKETLRSVWIDFTRGP